MLLLWAGAPLCRRCALAVAAHLCLALQLLPCKSCFACVHACQWCGPVRHGSAALDPGCVVLCSHGAGKRKRRRQRPRVAEKHRGSQHIRENRWGQHLHSTACCGMSGPVHQCAGMRVDASHRRSLVGKRPEGVAGRPAGYPLASGDVCCTAAGARVHHRQSHASLRHLWLPNPGVLRAHQTVANLCCSVWWDARALTAVYRC
jgi:hypothetical protein